MMHTRVTLFIEIASAFACLSVAGCAHDASLGIRVQHALDRLDAFDRAARESELCKTELNYQAFNECRSIVGKVDSPCELYGLFLECEHRARLCDWCDVNVYQYAYEDVLFKLGEIKSPESSRVLIKLLQDERFRSSAAISYMLMESLRSCGSLALDELEAAHCRNPDDKDIAWVIQLIEGDEVKCRE